MTLSDLASIGNIVAAIAVVMSLVYLSRQVGQANLIAKSNVRQRMVEQTHEELYQLVNDPELREAWRRSVTLSGETQSKIGCRKGTLTTIKINAREAPTAICIHLFENTPIRNREVLSERTV